MNVGLWGPPQPWLAQVRELLTRREVKGAVLMGFAGKDMNAKTNGNAGSTRWVDSNTTPKVPPPPPRRAQKRSGLVQSLAVRRQPSGVTILNCRTRSIPRP